MARKKSDSSRPIRPALTPEARENQLINLAVDRAEQMLRDGFTEEDIKDIKANNDNIKIVSEKDTKR